jgi:hypothetical protein
LGSTVPLLCSFACGSAATLTVMVNAINAQRFISPPIARFQRYSFAKIILS